MSGVSVKGEVERKNWVKFYGRISMEWNGVKWNGVKMGRSPEVVDFKGFAGVKR